MATAPKTQTWWSILAVFTAFAGLCIIFVSIVTAAQAWQEHYQAHWPTITAHVDTCALQQTSTGRRNRYYIRCRFAYVIGAEEHAANVYSINAPSPEVWQYPPNQLAPLEQRVEDHPTGTPILLHFNPANQKK
jgi:hypothetical protein